MNIHINKSQQKESKSVPNEPSPKQNQGEAAFQFVDNRSETNAQREPQEMATNSVQVKQLQAFHEMADNSAQAKRLTQLQAMANRYTSHQHQPIRKKENKTGLPDNLKAGIENLSGYAMDDVNVHYNSDKPAQLRAHAFAQGSDIHVAQGQEQYLPHEAWHVIQQKQGRVKPTIQMMDTVNVNDDVGLEKEADVMGSRAQSFEETVAQRQPVQKTFQRTNVVQLTTDIQRAALSGQFMQGNVNQIYIGRITADSTLRDNARSSIGKLRAGTVIAYQGNIRDNFSTGLTSVVKDHVYAAVVSDAAGVSIPNPAHWRKGWVVYENVETDSAGSSALHAHVAAPPVNAQVQHYLAGIANNGVIPARVLARQDLAPKAIKAWAEKSGTALTTPMPLNAGSALGAVGATGLAAGDLNTPVNHRYDTIDPTGELIMDRVDPASPFFLEMQQFLTLNADAMPGTMARNHELRDESVGGARATAGRAFLDSYQKGLNDADNVIITGATLTNIFVNSNAPTYAAYEANLQHQTGTGPGQHGFVAGDANWEPSATIRGAGSDALIDRMTKGRAGEYYLFHGSSRNNIFNIAKTGFDPEYVNYTTFKGYGKTGYGTAFTDQFAKALAYAPPEAIPAGAPGGAPLGGGVTYKHYILIGRVFAGRTHQVGDEARRTRGNLEMTQHNINYEESKGNKMKAQGQGMPHLGQSSSTVSNSYAANRPLHATVQDRNFSLNIAAEAGLNAKAVGPYRDTSLTISDAIQMFPAYIVEVTIPPHHMRSGTRA